MKHKANRITRIGGTVLVAAIAAGCEDVVVENYLEAMRDASAATATDAVNSFFESRFGITADDQNHQDEDQHAEEDHAHAGNNLFVRL